MKLTEFCSVLSEKLESVESKEKVRYSVLSLQQAFKVSEDEVALLKYNHDKQSLHFIWPEKLSQSGTIPLEAKNSFAVETYKDNKPMLSNRFTSKSHLSIFEQVNLDKSKNKAKDKKQQSKQLAIQKIMSVPLLKEAEVLGVIQVSRKAESREQAGADFTTQELDALSEIAKVIGKHI